MSTVTELLPRYTAASGDVGDLEVIELFTLNKHEAAWLRCTGHEPDGEPFTCYEFKCECDLTERIGWKRTTRHGFTELDPKPCPAAHGILQWKLLSLRNVYVARYGAHPGGTASWLREHLLKVIRDLAKQVKAGKFIGENSPGLDHARGHFLFATLATIVDSPPEQLHRALEPLIDDRKLSLDGLIIRPYPPPRPPRLRLAKQSRLAKQPGFVEHDLGQPRHHLRLLKS